MTVSLVCQTFVDPPQENKEITRDNLTCRITYCSSSKFKEYLFLEEIRVVTTLYYSLI